MPEQEEQSQWRLHSGQYLGEISALCFLQLPSQLSSLPYLLAGSGSQMLLYNLETGNLVRSFHVFDGIRVHGITCGSVDCVEGSYSAKLAYKLALFGEKRVRLFSLSVELDLSSRGQPEICVELTVVQSLPRFNHWVLDVCFLKGCDGSQRTRGDCLAIGGSDNSVHLWDVSNSSLILKVQSPERCLLYSMRLWGEDLEALRVASGTIYNEIIVWKIVSHLGSSSLTRPVKDQTTLSGLLSNSDKQDYEQFEAVYVCKLSGHEGSIFRIIWSSCGSKMVSVSDDRSARIWKIDTQPYCSDKPEQPVGPVLFGHSGRVWDCCLSESLIVTAGEDCTCRIWGLDGKQLKMIKEHSGRGIWRCLFDPNSSVLVTAGFDSAIKVHQLRGSLSESFGIHAEANHFGNNTKLLNICLPNKMESAGLMDSKSEYVRCLRFTTEDTLYVATNHGYLYHVKLYNDKDVKWTELACLSEEGPVVCMDLLIGDVAKNSSVLDDWVSLGNGKGNATVVRVNGNVCNPKVCFRLSWSAGPERQLLGAYWCRSLGHRYIFTADPRGTLKLWRLSDLSASVCCDSSQTDDISLVAHFSSCFGSRIMCLDASLEEEVLVCGDLRGNLVVFPLLNAILMGKSAASDVKISPLNYFKGAHGISTVSSVLITRLNSIQAEVCSTGADGCICYLEYNKDLHTLEFIGMKQVKELSLIQFVSNDDHSVEDPANDKYVAGFASSNFIIMNLTTETKVVNIPCGGWRRPHSFYLGDVPELKNCFAYVKDDIIYIHKNLVGESERKIIPQNLHMQFHGREMHSLRFVSGNSEVRSNVDERFFVESSWIATGCEDGTVRLTGFTTEVGNWSTSKLLGEHVGGSAVRSICYVSKTHVISSDAAEVTSTRESTATEGREDPLLLISVGAKRVLTSWLLRNRKLNEQAKKHIEQQIRSDNGCKASSGLSSSISFQWLSTDMPTKSCGIRERSEKSKKVQDLAKDVTLTGAKPEPVYLEKGKTESKLCPSDKYEDDWRYLAVTAFLVKSAGSRLTICFVVVASSDATLALRALILPHRLWFDVAVLVPLSTPVLALQHLVIPIDVPSDENKHTSNVYVVISGATDGSIALWDLTKSVEAFVRHMSSLSVEKFIDCQKRPRTGRGSQGGRWWRSSNSISKKVPGDDSVTEGNGERDNHKVINDSAFDTSTKPSISENISEVNSVDSSLEICEIHPLHVVNNVHLSGVNCLHVIKDGQSSCQGFSFNVISGGDDQALCCLRFSLCFLSLDLDSKNERPDTIKSAATLRGIKDAHFKGIRLSNHQKIASAHSSAVKGVWSDGIWVFSTGLDQRIRCWRLEHGKLTEHSHLIISVPEPEALDARACGKNRYQIAVAGRGMQMVDFSA